MKEGRYGKNTDLLDEVNYEYTQIFLSGNMEI